MRRAVQKALQRAEQLAAAAELRFGLAVSATEQACSAAARRSSHAAASSRHTAEPCLMNRQVRAFSAVAEAESSGEVGVIDPTGVWAYEVRAEMLAKNAALVRDGQLRRAQAAVATATPALPRHAAAALRALVATAPGDDLRRIAALAPMLTEDDTAALAAAVVLDTEAAYAAFLAILDARARESALGAWLEVARDAEDAAPPVAAPAALEAAAREVQQELTAAIRHHAYWERHLSDEDFAARHLPAGAAPADGAVAEKRAAVDAAFARTAAAAAATLNALPEVDTALLLSLRTGHRRWRLDQADWLRLAAILARVGGEASRSNALQRLVLAVRLRGKLELDARRVRRNPYLLEAVATGAAKMPAADAEALLAQWRRLPAGAAGRALTRVMRYAALTPREQPDLDQERLFVAGRLVQLVLEAMPNSLDAWRQAIRDGVAKLDADALRAFADALAAPRPLQEARLRHMVLRAVAPGGFGDDPDEFMRGADKLWRDADIEVPPADRRIIAEATPRVLSYLMHEPHDDAAATRALSAAHATQLAAALGTMRASELRAFECALAALPRSDVLAQMRYALGALAGELGMELRELEAAVQQDQEARASEMEADTQERLESARAAANTAAHVDACLPTAWVPPELAIPPVERVHPLEWQDTFTDLVYRLHGILHASVVSMDWDDFPKARLLFQLADALGVMPDEFMDYPELVRQLQHIVGAGNYDARLGHPQDAALTPGEARVLTLVQAALRRAAAEARADAGGGGDGTGEEEQSIAGTSANAALRAIVTHAARGVAAEARLLRPLCARVRWAFENVPRCVLVALARYWGDSATEAAPHLELAYACVRMSEPGTGLRTTAVALDYEQLLEMAHIAISRRLQEAGQLGADYVASGVRDARTYATVRRVLRDRADEGIDGVLRGFKGAAKTQGHLGHMLDLLPTAQDAVQIHAAVDAEMMDRVATGETSAAVSLEQFLHQEQSQAMARMKRPGAYTARLLAAGPAWLLPDLVQNIRDRPLPEVMDFLCRLHDLPTRPTTESLRAVFSWYDDGFLGGLPYEDDPVAAWAALEAHYLDDEVALPSGERIFLPQPTPDFADLLELHHGGSSGGAAAAAAAAPPLRREVAVDDKGRAHAVGRRKACQARVWVSWGAGDAVVNDMPLARYFATAPHRAAALRPLTALAQAKRFSILARITGGGKSCQAQAMQLGLARALVKLTPDAHRTLKQGGLLFRDPRVVERKKPTLKKARKPRQWVKR